MKSRRRKSRAGGADSPGPAPGKQIALCLLFAGSYAFGMPGYDIPALPFVCLVPFFFLADACSGAREAARWGFLAGTLANLLLFYWIAYTVAVPGGLGWALGGIAALLVSAYVGAYISMAAGIFLRLRDSFGEAGLLAFPAAWVCVEYARSVLFTGFPWVLFGYSLTNSLLLRQAADLAGMAGIGFLLASGNILIFIACMRLARGAHVRALLPAAGAAVLVAFLFFYGAWRVRGLEGEPRGAGIVAGIAQGGIDQLLKWDPAQQRGTLDTYSGLSREAKRMGAEVIVWPETAAPFFYGWEQELSAMVDNVALETGVPVIFGAPWFEPSGGGKYYNSVFHIDPNGVARGRYDKRHLVPFGEYIPLRSILFFMKKLTVGEEDFSAGTDPALFDVGGTMAGASVCYEAVFPEVIRDSVRQGATWLVNVTNDAWFGNTVAPRQHLAMARMRTVEFRRPMVRAANSGISAILDERGEVVARIGIASREAATGRIHPGRGETIYAKTGEIFGISCTIMTILFLAATWFVRRDRRVADREERK